MNATSACESSEYNNQMWILLYLKAILGVPMTDGCVWLVASHMMY